MKGIICSRARALAVSGIVAAGLAAAPATAGAVTTKTFSFIGKAGSRTATVVNANSLLINARCNTGGSPVVFGFSSAPAADVFARVFDGVGRTHFLKNTSFNRRSRGIQLSPSSADFDATATVLFEASNGNVVTVQMAMDNSTTLGGQRVCTVFGSMVAS
jgi:hypothetical protein